MKKNKQQIYIGITLLIFLSIGFYYLNFNNKKALPFIGPSSQNSSQDKEESKVETDTKKEELQIAPKVISENNIKISLIVLDKKYETEIKEGSSIFEAMKQIEEKSTNDNLFSFKYTEHSGLGSFITEINNMKGIPGKYWIYYINNEKASVGVSKYILKEGDIISWKQEGI